MIKTISFYYLTFKLCFWLPIKSRIEKSRFSFLSGKQCVLSDDDGDHVHAHGDDEREHGREHDGRGYEHGYVNGQHVRENDRVRDDDRVHLQRANSRLIIL